MRRLALISDSHIPGRAQSIPQSFRDRIRSADHVIHAGDFTTTDVLARVRDLADGNLTAVAGNMDEASLDLPRSATLDVANHRLVVIHGTGSPKGYVDRVVKAVRSADGDIGVAGHTHEVLDTTAGGVRLLNPGSVTGAAPADRPTMMSVTVDGEGMTVAIREA